MLKKPRERAANEYDSGVHAYPSALHSRSSLLDQLTSSEVQTALRQAAEVAATAVVVAGNPAAAEVLIETVTTVVAAAAIAAVASVVQVARLEDMAGAVQSLTAVRSSAVVMSHSMWRGHRANSDTAEVDH